MKRKHITSILAAALAMAANIQAAVEPTPLFNRLDSDHDGRVTREEFRLLAASGQGKYKDNPKVFDRLFERFDADQSSDLSQDEFAQMNVLRRRSAPQTSDVATGLAEQEALSVAMEDAVWIDTARQREVPVRIYAPDLKQGSGPFPVVVFSPGGGESREAFTYLGTYWAANGYITVFLTHPGSDRSVIETQGMRAMGGGGVKNFHLRPEDVRFVTDRLLSDDPGSKLLRGRIDPERIAVAGQCAGSSTALAMAGLRVDLPDQQDAIFIDPRFKCVIALSPQPGTGRGNPLREGSWAEIELPTLMVTGSRDFNWTPEAKATPNNTRIPFDGLSPGDKHLVEIKDAEHNAFTDSVPYYPARERDPRHHGWIQQATTAFLDAYLKSDMQAREWLQTEALERETQGECKQEQKFGGPDKFLSTMALATQAAPALVEVHGDLAADYSAKQGGRAVVVMIDGKIVFERYDNGCGPETTTHLHSATKGFWGPVIAAMIEDGLVESFDEPASKTLPEWKDQPRKSRITLRNLLSLNAGLVQDVVNPTSAIRGWVEV